MCSKFCKNRKMGRDSLCELESILLVFPASVSCVMMAWGLVSSGECEEGGHDLDPVLSFMEGHAPQKIVQSFLYV